MVRKGTEVVSLDDLFGWEQLQQDEQATIRKETEAARSSLKQESASRLEAGEHLANIRKAAKLDKMWLQICRTQLGISVASAYRYINKFQKTAKKLPRPFMAVAKERGYNISLSAVELNPPPQTDDKREMVKYLETVSVPSGGKRVVSIESNPVALEKRAFHEFDLAWQRIHGRANPGFLNRHIGMLLTLAGIGHKQSFEPQAIPEGFFIRPGRPKHKAA